jgi:hypothetical protein
MAGWWAGGGTGGTARRAASRSSTRELAERLVAQAREAGVDLVGPDGLLRQMTKAVL